jgi:oligopeptide/dipeptide ABC transporter ATP-binding protein
VQAVFQDPGTSLNARHRVGRIVAEGLRVHGLCRRAEEQARVRELLDLVGLAPEVQGRFPHQLAGGQRQRVAIARALAVEPALLICDEPVSSLDVSLRAQVLNLFHELRARLRLSILFISHDLSAVRAISHRVAVMYLGRIVEVGPVEAVFSRPGHPYTQALLAAVPRFPPERDRGVLRLRDEPPRGLAPPPGCAFHPRCPVAEPRCSRELPPRQAPGPRHEFLCIHAYATPPHPARGG